MGKISVFNHVSVDGFFAGPNGEIDWFKAITPDDEWYQYTHTQAGTDATLLFGRTTYQMMHSFWPTQTARDMDPGMAHSVNHSPKIVFSTTLTEVEEGENWKNVRHFPTIDPEQLRQLKQTEEMTILGSGSIIRQLATLDLIDHYTLVVVPVVLSKGKSLFEEVAVTHLSLAEARTFKNGLTLLEYEPVRD